MSDVYKVYSTIEPRLADALEFFDNPDNFPPEIKGVDITQHNNTVKVKSVPQDNISVGEYTPTALLKGTIKERRVVVDDDGKPTHKTVQQQQQEEWNPKLVYDEEEDVETTPVEYIGFKGRGKDVICNTALKHPMFLVLCDLAGLSHRGVVEGIVTSDGDMEAVRVNHEGGYEPVEVTVSVDEEKKAEEQQDENSAQVAWQDNDYI